MEIGAAVGYVAGSGRKCKSARRENRAGTICNFTSERLMIYRTLGRTGLKVSQLGFGAMRLPMTGTGDSARVNRELAVP